MKRKGILILDAAILLLSVVFTIGTQTFLRACGPHDGGWMSCHWAQTALLGLSCVLAIQAAVKLALRSPASKLGAALSMLPAALAAPIIPGGLIDLCMMATMRCRMVMKPGSTVLGILIACLCAAEALMLCKER